MTPKRAAIYARISQDRTGAGLGVERQREDCAAVAKSLGWAVVDVFRSRRVGILRQARGPGYLALLGAIEGVAWMPSSRGTRTDSTVHRGS